MTKYQLEEFKEWLEEKPERKVGLDWEEPNEEMNNNYGEGFLVAQRRAYLAYCGGGKFQAVALGAIAGEKVKPYLVVFDQWKAEVDQAEKEKSERTIQTLTQTNPSLTNKIAELKQRTRALEADKTDLISQLAEQKEKHQNHLDQEKSLLTQEITLIKEALHD